MFREELLDRLEKLEEDPIAYLRRQADWYDYNGEEEKKKARICLEILNSRYNQVDAGIALSDLYRKAREFGKAFSVLKHLTACKGIEADIVADPNVSYRLGLCYAQGLGCEQNADLAIHCLDEARNGCGDLLSGCDASTSLSGIVVMMESLMMTGIVYFELKKDYEKAFYFFKTSKRFAKKHFNAVEPLTSAYLGYLYFYGLGTKKSERLGMQLLQSAEEESPLANYWLSCIYEARKKHESAKQYYEKAANMKEERMETLAGNPAKHAGIPAKSQISID